MNIKDAYKYIVDNRPGVIYLSGKTSTGKSTFARELSDKLQYEVIELDEIVMSEVASKNSAIKETAIFTEVYKNRHRIDWIDQVANSVKAKMAELESKGVSSIVDGAIANPDTIKQVLGDKCIVVYMHPQDLDVYARNLTARFMTATTQSRAGLPAGFWSKIPKNEFDTFLDSEYVSDGIKDAIMEYAKESCAESFERLKLFKVHFNNIIVVHI